MTSKPELSREDVQAAVTQLAQSERGRRALTVLRDWFRDGDASFGLDGWNKLAVSELIAAAWVLPETTVEEIDTALAGE